MRSKRHRNCSRFLSVRLPLVLAAMLPALPATTVAEDTASGTPFVSFSDLMRSVNSARAENYMGQHSAKVRDAAEFAAMRSYLLTLYQGVGVSHSFALDDQVFDCVPIMQQPSVRQLGLSRIASPPPFSPSGAATASAAPEKRPTIDRYGNFQECADGTIPMRRITLDELSRFETLREFFKKAPGSDSQSQEGQPPTTSVTHRWAHAYEFVDNYGGQALHNAWIPKVNTSATEVFSLSQQWYTGGSGSAVQTAEIGWQNYPQKWGGQKATMFVYWTADDYNTTGCYNLECAGFVQYSSKHPLGTALTPVSKSGGAQYEEYFGYYLYKGEWWAAVGGSAKTSYWVGYLPVSIYKGGQMSNYATEFDIGGETAGETHWAPMGSGQWAKTGWQIAAYDRAIQYRDSSNNVYTPTLTPTTQGSNAYKCFSITNPAYSAGNGWLTYFYFGGPGGTKC